MKRIITFLLLFSPFFIVKSQILSIDNGLIHTATKYQSYDVCNRNSYATFISVDYVQKKKYYFNTQVGYHQTGYHAYLHNYLGNLADSHLFISDDLHLSTTVRYKIPIGKIFVYAGVGPKMDFTFNRPRKEGYTSTERYYYPYNDHFRNSFGGKFDFGVCYDYKKYRFGLNTAYMTNFNNGAKYLTNKYICTISIGYNFKK